jgi:hypothetical protein
MAERLPFEREVVSVSYVVLADVQGPIKLPIETGPLSRVFGSRLGHANVVALPGGVGFVVQMGPFNLFQVMGNRIEFKGATTEILYELYGNARNLAMVPPYNARAATAFGVNLEANYKFRSTTRDQLLAAMRPSGFGPSVSLEGMRFRKVSGQPGNVLNVNLEKSNLDAAALFFNFNNHIDRPNLSSYTLEDLTDTVNQLLTDANQFAEEVYQCGQSPN